MNARYEDFNSKADKSVNKNLEQFVQGIYSSHSQKPSDQQRQPFSDLEKILPNFQIVLEANEDQKPKDAAKDQPKTDKLSPQQLDLGKKLLQEGNFKELCKMAGELKTQGDQSFETFQKRLGESAKVYIAFTKDGVAIKFGDYENKRGCNFRDYEYLKINSNGTLGEAKTIRNGLNWQDYRSVETDAKTVYANLLEQIKNNAQEQSLEKYGLKTTSFDKQVAMGVELLKSGKFDELCKIAKNLRDRDEKDERLKDLVNFEQKLSAAAKVQVTFFPDGKALSLSTNDASNHRLQEVPVISKYVTVRSDGVPISALEVATVEGYRGYETVKNLDNRQTFDALMDQIKKNTGTKK